MDLERITSALNVSRERVQAAVRWLSYGALVVGGAYVLATALSALLMDRMMASALSSFTRMASSAKAATANVNMSSGGDNYRDIVRAIRDRNLFNSSGEFPDEKSPDAGDGGKKAGAFDINAPCAKPTMNIQLVGTIYLDGGSSIATMQEQGYTESDIYREGDLIVGNEQASIVRIERNRVVVNNGGVKECLELAAAAQKDTSGGFPDAAPTQPPEGALNSAGGGDEGGGGGGANEVVLDEKYVQDELGPGFGTIIQKARLVPNTTDNVMNGFKIFAIDSASLLARIGLKNGDIITQVNDTSLKLPEQGFALYQTLQDDKEIRIQVLRGGTTPTTLTVRVR